MPGVFFLDTFVKIASALEALHPDPFGFRRLRIRSRLVLLLLYTITTFYKTKILFAPGAGYASYATD